MPQDNKPQATEPDSAEQVVTAPQVTGLGGAESVNPRSPGEVPATDRLHPLDSPQEATAWNARLHFKRHRGGWGAPLDSPPDTPIPQVPSRPRAHAFKASMRKMPMVSWFNIRQLAHTGIQVAISSALGTRVDVRALEGFYEGAQAPEHCYEGSSDGELWFDYAADVGDGFRSSYFIAHCLARESIAATLPSNGVTEPRTYVLPRGRFLVLGGDQVYPIAGREQYRQRLLEPYQAAWDQAMGEDWKEGMPPRSDVEIFAIPGNHDWYDGLVSFRRLFCQDPALKQRYVGDWKASQGRSYFVIQLPHGWWLWAVDIQLESDIDESQLQYFSLRAGALKPGDRVILCTAEPEWVESHSEGKQDRNLYFLKAFIEARQAILVLSIAGDLHHYRHHVSAPNADDISRHFIISGGGGAFLHPTHNVRGAEGFAEAPDGRLSLPDGEFRLKAAFPSPEVSRSLTWGNLRFALLNKGLSSLLGGLHLAMAMGIPQRVDGIAVDPWLAFLQSPSRFLAEVSVLSWAILLAMLAAGIGVARSQNSSNKRFMSLGVAHGLAQGGSAVLFFFVYAHLACLLLGPEVANQLGPGLLRLFLYLGTMIVVAGTLVGLYFIAALNIFGEHANEAFSALSHEQYKQFLRFHIGKEGVLRIYPVGAATVTDDPGAASLELLEEPIEITPRAPSASPSHLP